MREYEVVGVLDAEVAEAFDWGGDGDAIAVEHDDPSERWVARPKGGDGS